MTTDHSPTRIVERAFSSYVKLCIQHASRDYFEKLRRDASYVIPMDPVTYEVNIGFCMISGASSTVEECPILSQILDQFPLSPSEKNMLRLKFCEDKTDKDIARLLGVSRQAVTKTKSNILIKLKGHMELK